MYKSICYRFHFITFGNGFGCFTFFSASICCTVFHWKEDDRDEEKKEDKRKLYVYTSTQFVKCCHTENWAIVMDVRCQAEGKKMKLKWSCALGFICLWSVCVGVSAKTYTMLLMQVRQIDWCVSIASLFSILPDLHLYEVCVYLWVFCVFVVFLVSLLFCCKTVRFLLASKSFLSIDSLKSWSRIEWMQKHGNARFWP